MTTGLRSRDSYLYNWQGLNDIEVASRDWPKYILKLKSEAPGGTRFDYSNLASYLLGEIVRQKTGLDVSDYAEKVLFTPLGITDYRWATNGLGQSTGWAGLYLRPVDIVKIGRLILHNGDWEGEQLVSSKWIDEATSPSVSAGTFQPYYGYQWWIDQDGRILAIGYKAQYLIIDRELDAVTFFSSELPQADFFLPYSLYKTCIVPALRGEEKE